MFSGQYEFGAYRLEAHSRMLFRGGDRVALPPKVAELLVALVQAAGGGFGAKISGCRQDIDPGIEDLHARSGVFFSIARNHRHAMMLGRSRDDQIGLRECMSRLAALIDQEAPLEHDVFRNCQRALFEHWPHFVRQPVIQIGSTRCVRQLFDAKAYFGERNNTDEEPFQRLRAYECRDFGFGLRSPKLGDDIGVEQPSCHRETSRTGGVVR